MAEPKGSQTAWLFGKRHTGESQGWASGFKITQCIPEPATGFLWRGVAAICTFFTTVLLSEKTHMEILSSLLLGCSTL